MTDKRTSKAETQARFGQYAGNYIASVIHARGADLDRLVDLVAPCAEWSVLDIATGGGHTALRFAPLVNSIIAADLTPRMLEAARRFITEHNIENIRFVAADAEQVAFASATFDLVTCRIAPHHFPDCFHFVQECARVLKPEGLLVIEDHVLPEDDRAARYIDAFERLRDPTHYRAFAAYEWRGMLLDAGLTIETEEFFTHPANHLIEWAERQECPPDVIDRLQVMLAQAPAAVSAFMRPRHAGTAGATFDHHYIMIAGRKSD